MLVDNIVLSFRRKKVLKDALKIFHSFSNWWNKNSEYVKPKLFVKWLMFWWEKYRKWKLGHYNADFCKMFFFSNYFPSYLAVTHFKFLIPKLRFIHEMFEISKKMFFSKFRFDLLTIKNPSQTCTRNYRLIIKNIFAYLVFIKTSLKKFFYFPFTRQTTVKIWQVYKFFKITLKIIYPK